MYQKTSFFIRFFSIYGMLLIFPLVSPGLASDSEWESIGPEGGFLLSFAIAPSSPEVLYAGCDVYGGIYKSTNGGERWDLLGILTELGEILDIQIHPQSSDTVFVACGKGGVYRTTDGGLNWEQVFQREALAFSLGIDPNSPNIVYAGFILETAAEFSLYRSTDGGTTWPDSSFQGNPVVDICFDPDVLNTVYAGTSGGVHRSTDAGMSWTSCGPPAPSVTIQSLAIVDFNTFYAGTSADARDAGTVYKTTDGGENWTVSYNMGTTVYGLAVDPDMPGTVYMAAGSNMFGREGVFKTTDGGDNWFPANNGLVDRMARGVYVDPVSSNVVYAIADGLGGVYKSTDRAVTWTQSTAGMRQVPVQAMCFDDSHTLYAAAGWGTYKDMPCLFKSEDNGLSWDTLRTIPSPYYMTSIWDVEAYPGSSDLIFVGGTSHYSDTIEESSRGLLYRSSDGGETWEALWTPEDIWITCLAIDPVTENIYAGTGGGDASQVYKIHKSTDGGDTWEETSGWPSAGNSIFDIAVDAASPNRLFAATGGAVFMSTDYGDNWIPRSVIPLAYTLLIDPDSPNTLYVGSGGPYADSGGIYKSTDSGVNWELIGLEDHAVTSLVGTSGPASSIYAGTGGKFLETSGSGVFQSTDGGTAWQPMNACLASPFILSMRTDPHSPGTLYAGTLGRGLFKTTVETGIEAAKNDDVQNMSFALSNFPNPFNASTTIHYTLPCLCQIALKVFDIQGREIRILSREVQTPGTHSIVWNGMDDDGEPVASGMYFYQLQTSTGHTQTKKMILLE